MDSNNKRGITIGQLITELTAIANKYGYNLEVYTEGCDCFGACSGASYDPKENWPVLVGRVE